MNKNVFEYLNGKAQDLANYIKTKAESANNYLSDNAKNIKNGAIRTTATLLTAAAVLGGMTACDNVIQPSNDTESTTTSSTTTTEQPPIEKNPLLTGNSNSGRFEGERYNEEDKPVINHRTEEEIAQTGLTAQDVLNAYDQLCLDLAKGLYSTSNYIDVPQEEYNKLAVEFECIKPAYYYSEYSQQIHFPFYSINNHYYAKQSWQNSTIDGSNHFPAYSTSIEFKSYIDGVCFTQKITNIGIEESEFEKTMEGLGITSEYFSEEDFKKQYDNPYHIIGIFANQDTYAPTEISRDTIQNATPEQLKVLYNMINSLRSINLEQRLPDNTNESEMTN